MPKINRAIVSVTDKTGIVEFCRGLASFNVEILSTGGTAKTLREAGVAVKEVSDFTGFPEAMDGRLKTLHPKIEGGILGIRGNPSHRDDMKRLGILPIDMVVVNPYAFEETISRAGVTLEESIEKIDIGGPTMLRAAAKNNQDVTVVMDPADYPEILAEMKASDGSVSAEKNFKLALKVFRGTSFYDAVIASGLSSMVPLSEGGGLFPGQLTLPFRKVGELRYGENPHQAAAFYQEVPRKIGILTAAKQLHGKELSFNNLLDLEAALQLVRDFDETACVIIKHNNPCGVAVGKNLREAFLKAKECDPISSFGGIVGFNREVDAAAAQTVSETFFECVIAPVYEEGALKLLQAKKNIRLMSLSPFGGEAMGEFDLKKVSGGLLVQQKDHVIVDLKSCPVPTKKKPTAADLAEAGFAWKVVCAVKSNAIVFTRGGQTLGIGAGQMSRVDSVKLAVMKMQQAFPPPLRGGVSGETSAGRQKANRALFPDARSATELVEGEGGVPIVLASDAFFPFRDGVDEAAKAGISGIVQPGSSVKDEEVIKAADEAGLFMILTGVRHFRH